METHSKKRQPEKAVYHNWPFWKYKNVPATCFSIKGRGRLKNLTFLLLTLVGAALFLLVQPISRGLTNVAQAYVIDLAFFLFFFSLFIVGFSQMLYPVIFIDPDCYDCSAKDYLIERERSKLRGTYSKHGEKDPALESARAALVEDYASMRFEICPACQIEKIIESSSVHRQIQKAAVTPEILQEWDVARRTAEFFDGALGNLRTYGLTASVTLVGIALEFHVSPLLLASALLNAGLFFVDKRYESYLIATAAYSIRLEDKYRFADEGLGHAIHRDREKHWLSRPEHIFRFIYAVLATTAIIGFFTLTSI